jgi:hypothetical protein
MSLEVLHFRGSDKIIESKNMMNDVMLTLEYVDHALTGSIYRREILHQVMDEMGWVGENGDLRVIPSRRYMYKGYKKGVAIEAQFSMYEYILEGLLRLQIGYDKKRIEVGLLLLNGYRPERPLYGSSSQMAQDEIDFLYPTISLPVMIALFDFGQPVIE